MARKLRVDVAGSFYHCMNRANARLNINFEKGDFILFLKTLKEAQEIFENKLSHTFFNFRVFNSIFICVKIFTMKIKLCMLLFLLSFSFVHAYEFPINSCPATTDLFDHMSEQINDRIEGVTASNSTKSLFSTRGNLTSPWVWSSTAWTTNNTPLDFTGMSPWNSRGGYTRAGTLITPRHIALADHYLLSVGDTVLFVDGDNNVITRTVTNVSRVLSSDISIAKLDSDLPSAIAYYPILDNLTYEKYLNDGYDMDIYDLPFVVFDQEDHAIIKDTKKNHLISDETLIHMSSQESSRLTFNETLIGGDSGNSGFVLIGNKPVLVLTHYSSGSGPSYSYYKDNIQDVIDAMGGEYQLSTINLDCFNAPIVLENNTDLKVVQGSAEGTLIGTTTIKYNIENDTPYFSFVSGNEAGALAINSSTGVITVASSTLIQSPLFPRTVEVGVEENAPGGRMSKNSYTVSIVTYPYLNVESYSFSLDEHSANTTVVGDINAFDTQNDTLEYAITSGNESGIFAINSSTGVITVANTTLLNYETNSSHQLVVTVRETATEQHLTATIEVNITVNDLNYTFSQNSYSFEIDELDADASSVGSVSASILDTNSISEIYYQISSGNSSGIFEINSSTGAIIITDNTNLDGNDIYNLIIGVSDGVSNPILSSIAATIQVTMDSRPTLSYQAQVTSLVRYTVEEGSGVSMIFELSAPYTKSIVATFAQISGNATLGSDYSLNTGTLTFLPGETTKTVTFNASTDSTNEGDETVLLNIVDNTRVTYGPRKNATITINNKAAVSSGGGGGGGGGSSKKKETETIKETTVVGETSQVVAPTVTKSPQATIHSSFSRNLELGTTGDDVKKLQELLMSKGYAIPAGITGYFGSQTRSILIKYQQDNNITPAVGYFGVVTRAKILQ